MTTAPGQTASAPERAASVVMRLQQNGLAVVSAAGDHAYHSRCALGQVLRFLTESPTCSALVIDTTGVTQADSWILSLIVAVFKQLTDDGGRVVIVPGPCVGPKLTASRLAAIMHTAGTLEAACLALGFPVPTRPDCTQP